MTNEPHDHAGRGWYGGPDEYGDGRTDRPYGWGGESDADATAFVQLPPGGLPGDGPDPLAAPGTGQGGWEPPPIDPAADAGPPAGTPMTPAAGLDPASTGQWTMPFAAQPQHQAPHLPEAPPAHPAAPQPEPDGGAGGAMSRGPAAALGQGAAAALAGSHEARTHRRPLGAGGAAGGGGPDPAGPADPAQHGTVAEQWPQPEPSPSWRADQEAMLADALARRQVPLPGAGAPQQAPGWDDTAHQAGGEQSWPADTHTDPGTGTAWHPDARQAPDAAGTPPHGFSAAPGGPADDGRWAAAPWAPAETGAGEEYGTSAHGTPAHGFPATGEGGDTGVVPHQAAWHDAPGSPPATDPAAGPGPVPSPQDDRAEHTGTQDGTIPSAAQGDATDPTSRPHHAEGAETEMSAPATDSGTADAAAAEAATSDGTPEPAPTPPAEDADVPAPDPAPAADAPAAEAPADTLPEPEPTPEDRPATVSDHPHISYLLHVNGADRPVSDAWIGESLLYVLRERLGLAGAKDGCSQGECGACSVQMDGRLVAACLVPAATAVGTDIRTVEGLAGDEGPSDVQRALADSGAVQCGFCVPGLAMAVHDLLEGNHAPTELETRQALCGNLCRCSGYRGVLDAVQQVAGERADRAAREAAQAEAVQQAGGTPTTGAGGTFAGDPHIPQQAQYGGGEGVR